jgi:hypothetical protein
VNVIMPSVVTTECRYAKGRGAPDPTFDQNAEGKLENILIKREEM